MSDEKLQKVLARSGFGSRREVEEWIRAGRVSVDGAIATLGARVTGKELIRIDGHPTGLRNPEGPRRRVLIYHKPEGEVCTRSDPEGRPTVFDHLPLVRHGRWVTVGRMDLNTSGLLLLTTDGELANRLMHPSQEVERQYAVRVLGAVEPTTLQSLRDGVELEDGSARFQRLVDVGGEGANHWYHVVLKEGRNREVRRLWEACGVQVSRLIRVRFGPISLPRGLRRGRWEEAPLEMVQALLALVGIDQGEAKVQSPRHTAKNTGQGARKPPLTRSSPRSRDDRGQERRPPRNPESKRPAPQQGKETGTGSRAKSGRPSSSRPSSNRPGSGRPTTGRGQRSSPSRPRNQG